jgi:hypothetical protein
VVAARAAGPAVASSSRRLPVASETSRHRGAVLIEEADPNEPGLLAHKYYVRDLGMVRDVSVGGPLEELKLQSV